MYLLIIVLRFIFRISFFFIILHFGIPFSIYRTVERVCEDLWEEVACMLDGWYAVDI